MNDDDITDEDVDKAQHALEESVKVARAIFRQLTEQGADNAVLHLIGLELSAMALHDQDNPAPEGVKIGAVAMYAHRILEKRTPIQRGHLQEKCKICEVISDLEEDHDVS
jgi:hypothetical protein